MKARISNLTKTESEWSKLNFKPMPGELIIYAPDSAHKYSRLKIGDGVTLLHELPFVVDSIVETILSEYRRQEILDGGCITDYFN